MAGVQGMYVFNCKNEINISALRLTFLDYHDKVVLALDQLEC